MQRSKRQQLTIVAEKAIENLLVNDLKRLGARGHTRWYVAGEGTHGSRQDDWEQSRNVCIQVICDPAIGEAVLEHLYRKYYQNYAIIATVTEVEVLRAEKF